VENRDISNIVRTKMGKVFTVFCITINKKLNILFSVRPFMNCTPISNNRVVRVSWAGALPDSPIHHSTYCLSLDFVKRVNATLRIKWE
jgi:hypothetical protein